ncbi:MAG: GIY-YIG nuclease family protein [Gammaproteobacteria bacterium]|nr:GIY-YIG nuclease family protein [Gammaproteobacteria bacterium]
MKGLVVLPSPSLNKAWRSPRDRREAFLSHSGEIDVDGTVLFRGIQRQLVPEEGGVYLIHDLRGVLYVGQSNDLQRRFDEHRLRQSNPYLFVALNQPFGEMRFSWIRTTTPEETGQLESWLIAWLQPAYNRLIPTS